MTTQKTILLMRHAKSSWDDGGMDDFDRPLNPRGQRDAPRMGQFLREKGLVPAQIFSSPAARAKATIYHVVRELGLDQNKIKWEPDLYFNGANAYLEAIRSADESSVTVMTTGHNPMTEQLVTALASSSKLIVMPTAAIACFSTSAKNWKQVIPENCELKWLVTPKEL